jgi:hypothetical protein
MKTITKHYMDEAFVESHGREFGTFGIEVFLELRLFSSNRSCAAQRIE